METETKQRRDINQGNATAWRTANDTTRKQNKRESEISVREGPPPGDVDYQTDCFTILSVFKDSARRQVKVKENIYTTESKESLKKV